jgi:hypothetical protein
VHFLRSCCMIEGRMSAVKVSTSITELNRDQERR